MEEQIEKKIQLLIEGLKAGINHLIKVVEDFEKPEETNNDKYSEELALLKAELNAIKQAEENRLLKEQLKEAQIQQVPKQTIMEKADNVIEKVTQVSNNLTDSVNDLMLGEEPVQPQQPAAPQVPLKTVKKRRSPFGFGG